MYANLSFFAGVLLMALVNRLVHTIFVASARSGERAAVYFGTGSRPASPEHDAAAIHAVAQIEDKQRLLAMAAVVSAAIVLHNIPEGAPRPSSTPPPSLPLAHPPTPPLPHPLPHPLAPRNTPP